MRSLLFVSALFAACGYGKDLNPNNGVSGALDFFGAELPLAVGQPVTIQVERLDSGPYRCTPSIAVYPGLGGGGDGCTFVGKHLSIASLTAARCATDACTATVSSSSKLVVTAAAAGDTSLVVDATLDDGTEVEDSVPLKLLAPDAIVVYVDDPSHAVGPNAIFIGTKLQLFPHVSAGEEPIERMPEVIAEPAGIVTVKAVDAGSWSGAFPAPLELTARAAGRVKLRFRTGAIETVRELRVVEVSEVVGFGLYERADGYGPDVGFNLAGAEVHDTLHGATSLVVGWKLEDGTLAIGKAGNVASMPDVTTVYDSRRGEGFFTELSVRSSVSADVVFTGQVGAQPFTLQLRVEP